MKQNQTQNHPTREEWMEFIYEETDDAGKLRLAAHLQSCTECQRQVAAWRGAMARLDQWEIPARASWQARPGWARWAAAAAILLAAGITIGAAGRSTPDLAKIRAQLEPAIKASIENDIRQSLDASRAQFAADLRQRIDRTAAETSAIQQQLAQLSKTMAENRALDKEALVVTLRELEARRLSDLQSMRRDLETVAVLTEEGFNRAQSQFVRLASYMP